LSEQTLAARFSCYQLSLLLSLPLQLLPQHVSFLLPTQLFVSMCDKKARTTVDPESI
jgi:hypothetical protein